MVISFIGAGKVATALGKYFTDKGIAIDGYYSKSFESARLAANLMGATAYQHYSDLAKNCKILFITTPDDYIKETCDKLSKEGCLKEGMIIIHTSGAHSSNILSSAKEKGCFIYSLHPLQSFAKLQSSIDMLPKTIFSLEGDQEKRQVIEQLLKKLGNQYFTIETHHKALYHAAACIVSNYVTALIDCGIDIFGYLSIERDTAVKAIMPLVEGTISNIKELDTAKALTGPIARGDVGTVESHIKEIKNNIPEKLSLYSVLGSVTVDLALKHKLKNNEEATTLKKMLEDNLNGQ